MSTPVSEPGDKALKREIRHLIHAAGYAAVFFDEETGEPWADTLVGWALVAESSASGDDVTKVLGLVADGKTILFADDFPNFVGYLAPEGGLDDWKEDVRKAWEEQQSQDADAPEGLHRKKSWFDGE
jgi:hypothetical protein